MKRLVELHPFVKAFNSEDRVTHSLAIIARQDATLMKVESLQALHFMVTWIGAWRFKLYLSSPRFRLPKDAFMALISAIRTHRAGLSTVILVTRACFLSRLTAQLTMHARVPLTQMVPLGVQL